MSAYGRLRPAADHVGDDAAFSGGHDAEVAVLEERAQPRLEVRVAPAVAAAGPHAAQRIAASSRGSTTSASVGVPASA